MMATAEYTPTETRLMTVLGDGLRHTREELRTCIDDELAGPTALQAHISNMRKKLNPGGLDIICENRMGIFDRLIRMINKSE